MIVKISTQNREYRFINIYIEHSWFEFARAEVHITELIQEEDMKADFTITVNSQVKFKGKIAQIIDDYTIELIHVIDNHHELGTDMNWLIKCLRKNRIQSYGVIWSPTEIKGRNIFDLQSPEYQLNDIQWITMKKSIGCNQPNYELSVNVQYNNIDTITEDLSREIFGPDGIKTSRPEHFLECFKLGRVFENTGTVITKSKIGLDRIDKANYCLTGIVEITRRLKVACNELWTHKVDNNNSNTIYGSIDLDMSDYFKHMPHWEPRHEYYKGMIVIYDSDEGPMLLHCKASHTSNMQMNLDYWEETEDLHESLEEDCLYNSTTGKKMHATLLNYIILQIWMYNPVAQLEFTTCSYISNQFELGDVIFDPITKKRFILLHYVKHYGNNINNTETSSFKAFELPFDNIQPKSKPIFEDFNYSELVKSDLIRTRRSINLVLGSEKIVKNIEVRTTNA